ncbi:hypothetical protein ACOMHN_045171 [Nucella lapillus]
MSSPESDVSVAHDTQEMSDAALNAEEEMEMEAAEAELAQERGVPGPAKKRKSSKQSKLTEEQEHELLDYLREHPHLYDKSQKLYKDAAKKQRDWYALDQKLGIPLGDSCAWVRTKRTMLAKAKRKVSKSGSSAGSLTPSLQWCFDHMSFLIPHIQSVAVEGMGPTQTKEVTHSRRKRPAAVRPLETDLETDAYGSAGMGSRALVDSEQGASTSAMTSPPVPRLRLGSSKGLSMSSSSQPSERCGHLCKEIESVIQQFATPHSAFWNWCLERTKDFDDDERDNLEVAVGTLVTEHVRAKRARVLREKERRESLAAARRVDAPVITLPSADQLSDLSSVGISGAGGFISPPFQPLPQSTVQQQRALGQSCLTHNTEDLLAGLGHMPPAPQAVPVRSPRKSLAPRRRFSAPTPPPPHRQPSATITFRDLEDLPDDLATVAQSVDTGLHTPPYPGGSLM